MTQMLPTLRLFAPETWGEVERFKTLHGKTYPAFSWDVQKAVSGVGAHFEKAQLLRDLALKLLPNLQLDSTELRERGHTPAWNARESTAVVEAAFLELYSSVDCARKVLVAACGNLRGMPDSTRKLFQRAITGSIPGLPGALRDAFVAASWYNELRILRDELTHASIGQCRQEDADGPVTFFHTGVTQAQQPLIVADVFGKINDLMTGVNAFLGAIFHWLNMTLHDEPILVFCALTHGRMYARHLCPIGPIDFHSGSCASRAWFDEDPALRCPFADRCGAYESGDGTPPA